MTQINTDHFEKCIKTLETSLVFLEKAESDSIEYEMYRNSLVKGFELTLEQGGKLLKKKMMPYFATKKQADMLTFKDIFRHANKHGLLTIEETERWLNYRDNRNTIAHDYGEKFAEETIILAKRLITDAKKIVEILQ